MFVPGHPFLCWAQLHTRCLCLTDTMVFSSRIIYIAVYWKHISDAKIKAVKLQQGIVEIFKKVFLIQLYSQTWDSLI